jgi:hypothetical protein
MQVVVQTCHVHTRVVPLVGNVHMCIALLKGHVPIEKLFYFVDLFIFSVGAELCNSNLAF